MPNYGNAGLRSQSREPSGSVFNYSNQKMKPDLIKISDGRGSLQDARFRERRMANRSKDIMSTSINPQRRDPRALMNFDYYNSYQDPSQTTQQAGGNPRSTHQHHAVSALDLSRYRGRAADHRTGTNDPALRYHHIAKSRDPSIEGMESYFTS